MFEINKWSYEINNFIEKNDINNIIVNSCIEEDDNICELKLTIYGNHNLKILSDFKSYCYIESSLYNTDELNQHILFSNKYKSLESIINTVINFKFYTTNITKKIKYNDKFHFYKELEEKTKLKLNYKELETEIKTNKNKNSLLNIKIPKELLLNNNQINHLIITEMKKINSNYEYKHIIEPINNNIFSLKATLFLQNINVIIQIDLNNNLYPFYPPTIELISPRVKLSLYFAIINLNITKITNWNSSLSLEWIIINLADKLNPIIDNYIDNLQTFNELEHVILKLSNVTKEQYSDKLTIDFVISSVPNNDNIRKDTWKSGTGYGSSNCENNWNINNYIKEKQIIQNTTCELLKQINTLLNENNLIFIKDSYLLKYIINKTYGINLLEIENEHLIFNEIIKILSTIKLFNYFQNNNDIEFVNNIVKNLQPINDEIIMLFQNNEELQNNELYQGLYNIFQLYNELIVEPIIVNNIISDISIQESYCNIMKPLQFSIGELSPNHKFNNNKPEPRAMKRIISEISSFKNGLPLNYESSIWVKISKTNMSLFTFLISGPKDTPYENGLFLFNASFPSNYPQIEPKVLLVTTGNGSVRFNPNLYNCGKVCLSLLGTWSGNESEKWNPQTSTFLQVLVSIQSLILIDQPYFNEPGYEREMNTKQGDKESKLYNNNIQYENIRWAMIDQINNPPLGYEEVVKNHFKLKKNDIIKVLDKWVLDNQKIEIEVIKLKELLNNM